MGRRTSKSFFEVDRRGLAKLLEGKDRAFAVFELVQNAWDQEVTRVDVSFQKIPGKPAANLVVVDDDPEGFRDITHAYTLFAESAKKADPDKRGRFNIGEKFVLALCNHARITTTTGCVELTTDGSRRHPRSRRETGSEFAGELRITASEHDRAIEALRTLIPPEGIETYINGEQLPKREPVADFHATLPTVIADEQGGLSKTRRKTRIRLYDPLPGEIASIYEMGIPVVVTGDRWHVDVGQKVPVNMDRDNVPPAYLRELRTLVVNEMFPQITQDDANSAWAKEALGNPKIESEAVKAIVAARFGDKVVRYDPSDSEANKLATSKGYQVVHGGTLSADEWNNVKRAGVVLPAGKVTPSPKPYSPGGHPERLISPSDWSTEMTGTTMYATNLARLLMDRHIDVKICDEPSVSWSANYGHGTLALNVGLLGRDWFSQIGSVEMNELFIHEFGHEYSGDHLSEAYHDALCHLGAKLTHVALSSPDAFDAKHYLEKANQSRGS